LPQSSLQVPTEVRHVVYVAAMLGAMYSGVALEKATNAIVLEAVGLGGMDTKLLIGIEVSLVYGSPIATFVSHVLGTYLIITSLGCLTCWTSPQRDSCVMLLWWSCS
jgi:hypothetical protein